MYKLAVWVILTFPYVGLILIQKSPDEYVWLTHGNQTNVPLIYYGIFLVGAIVATIGFKGSDFKVINHNVRVARHKEYSLLVILFILLGVIFINFGGFDVLTGVLSKEDVRKSGFLHGMLTKYLVPSIFSYFCVLRSANIVSKSSWLLAFLMTVAIGLSTGGKASVLIIVLPGLAILYEGKLSIRKVIIIGVSSLLLLIGSAWLFDSFLERDVVTIVQYLIRRAFALTAETPYHVSLAYSENQQIIVYHYTLFEIIGKNILSHFVPEQEIYKYLFSLSITAWLYPNNIDLINSGAWNLTPNVFVEVLLVGGTFALPFLGWAVVYVAYASWRRVVRMVNRGDFVSAAVLSVYLILVYLSWINSAGIMQLIHPLALGSLALSWLCLKTFSKARDWRV